MLEFYPGALEGLIQEYLWRAVENILHHNSCETFPEVMFDLVMEMYEKSPEYRISQYSYPPEQNHHYTLFFMCSDMAKVIREFVWEKIDFFRNMFVDPRSVVWVGDMVLMEICDGEDVAHAS